MQVFLTSTRLAIVFEYASGGNLAHYIETFQSSKHGRGISEVGALMRVYMHRTCILTKHVLDSLVPHDCSRVSTAMTKCWSHVMPHLEMSMMCLSTCMEITSEYTCLLLCRNGHAGFSSRLLLQSTFATRWASQTGQALLD